MRVISIYFLVIAITSVSGQSCQWEDLCLNNTCPDGMTCSTEQQHCVCINNFDYTGKQSIILPITVFDFQENNTDFEVSNPDPVNIDSRLGKDNTPIFINNTRYDSWYHSLPGINRVIKLNLTIEKNISGIYILDKLQYFPIDNMGWGNEDNPHNYHFTTEMSWTVDYKGGEYMYLRFDDGILIYLNGWLVVDQPGLHFNGNKYLKIDSIAGDAGIVPGNAYSLRVFHMERHLSESIFYIETNLTIHPVTCPRTCESNIDCGNGICHPFEKICKCQSGWAGDYCNQELCLNKNCGNHGICDSYTGKCFCDIKWTGDQCDTRKCNYRGSCKKNDVKCRCDRYYSGDDCERCSVGHLCHKNDLTYSLVRCDNDKCDQYRSMSDYFIPGTNNFNCLCHKVSINEKVNDTTINYYMKRLDALDQNLELGSSEFIVDETSGVNTIISNSYLVSIFIYLLLLPNFIQD